MHIRKKIIAMQNVIFSFHLDMIKEMIAPTWMEGIIVSEVV